MPTSFALDTLWPWTESRKRGTHLNCLLSLHASSSDVAVCSLWKWHNTRLEHLDFCEMYYLGPVLAKSNSTIVAPRQDGPRSRLHLLAAEFTIQARRVHAKLIPSCCWTSWGLQKDVGGRLLMSMCYHSAEPRGESQFLWGTKKVHWPTLDKTTCLWTMIFQ